MGYNATEIITRFIRYAGQPDGLEPGKGKGRYRERFPDGGGSSLHYATDRQRRVVEIQSYGSWFPLAHLLLHPSGRRKMWLLNGDRWPGSGGFGRTNEHNDIARMAAQASGTPCFTVPFSALRAAGIQLDTIKPVQIEPESYTYEDHSAATLTEVPDNDRKRAVWTDEAGQVIEAPRTEGGGHAWPDHDGSWSVQEHRLGEAGYAWYKTAVDGPAYTGQLTHEYTDIEPGRRWPVPLDDRAALAGRIGVPCPLRRLRLPDGPGRHAALGEPPPLGVFRDGVRLQRAVAAVVHVGAAAWRGAGDGGRGD